MKQALLISALVAFLACPAFAQSSNTPGTPPTPPASSPMSRMSLISPEEQAELRKAHDAAMAADPSLVKAVQGYQAEMRELQKKGQVLQDRMRDAMIKADPKVTPIIAKIEAMRQGGLPPPTGNPQSPPAPPQAPH